MSTPINILVNLLARREYSEFELRKKLADKKFSADEISNAITYVREKNWQSDFRFAENYINYKVNRGYAKYKIILDLKHKGINDLVIQDVFDNLQIDWSAIAKKLIDKKLTKYLDESKIDISAKQKIWRYMLNHGFHPDDFAEYLNI